MCGLMDSALGFTGKRVPSCIGTRPISRCRYQAEDYGVGIGGSTPGAGASEEPRCPVVLWLAAVGSAV